MLRKKPKYVRMYLGGGLPETRKERDKLYRLLEKTNIMQQLLSGSVILIPERGAAKGRLAQKK